MSTTIISAARGEGKTTYLLRYVAQQREKGRSVGGIASPAVFDAGIRIGYDVQDLRNGQTRPLARTTTGPARNVQIGPYFFDDQGIATGIAAILGALRDRLDFIAIDEIGPLEFSGKVWFPALENVLRSCTPAQELILVVRASLVAELPKRFPSHKWVDARQVSPPWPGPF